MPIPQHQPEWRKGSAKAIESISLATFWGRSSRGIDISFIDFFLHIRFFYSFTIHRSTDRFWLVIVREILVGGHTYDTTISSPSILTLCSFASLFRLLRRFIPTALMLTFTFYAFYYAALIRLTDYRLVYYRRREIGDITTIGSYYEGSGTSER